MRGCYTAMATAHMLGLDKNDLASRSGMVEYVKRCQVTLMPFMASHPHAVLTHAEIGAKRADK